MITFENEPTIAVPAKGRLSPDTLRWLNDNLGTDFKITKEPFKDKRSREVTDSDTGITVVGFSNDDIAQAVAGGLADLGIAGSDKVIEAMASGVTAIKIEEELGYGACKLVLARREEAKDDARVYNNRLVTSYSALSSKYVGERPDLEIEGIDVYKGGVEVAARLSGAEWVIDVAETGESLTANGYTEERKLYDCEAVLITRK